MLSPHSQSASYSQAMHSQRSASGAPSYLNAPAPSNPLSSFPGSQYGGGHAAMIADANRFLPTTRVPMLIRANTIQADTCTLTSRSLSHTHTRAFSILGRRVRDCLAVAGPSGAYALDADVERMLQVRAAVAPASGVILATCLFGV
jgi:hypothetical protein